MPKAFVARTRRICGVLSAVAGVCLSASTGSAQVQQFAHDLNGNLELQAGETLALPQLLSAPQAQIVRPGEAASFFVVAANTRGLAYEWRFNGSPIAGATRDALLVTNVSALHQGLYSAVLANSSGSITSAPAALWIDADRDGLADTWEQAYFGNLTNNPTADFDGDGAANLDEFQADTNPTNSASAQFQLTLMSDGGKVEASPAKLTYTNGEVVTLTATAYPPEIFHGWTGAVISRTNPLQITMNRNQTIFANFQSRTLTWVSRNGGSWHNPTNWAPPLVPTAIDDVFLTNTLTVVIDEPAACRNLNVPSGATLTAGAEFAVHGKASSSFGNLNCNQKVSFLGEVDWNGDMNIDQEVIAHQTFTWRGGNLGGNHNLRILQAMNWTGGFMRGSGRTLIENGATLTINNPTDVSLTTRTLENQGTIIWAGTGNMGINNSAVITNAVGAIFQIENASIINSGGFSRIDNAGLIRKSSAGTSTLFLSLNNSGQVEVQAGTFWLPGGGNHTGPFTVLTGALLQLSGIHVASPSASITGEGGLTLGGGGGTITWGGLVSVHGNNNVSGPQVTLNGTYVCTNNTLAISSGNLDINGSAVVAPAVLNLTGGSLGGSALVRVPSVMTWTGGSMSGSGRTIIESGANLTINSPNGINLTTRTLENRGTITWSGAGNMNVNNGVITNGAGGLFLIQNTATVGNNGGSPRVDNAGIIRKTSPGTTTSFIAWNNYNLVEVQAGTLWLPGGGSHAGTFDVPAGTALQLSGTHSAGGSASITGQGELIFGGGGGTVTWGGLVSVRGTNTFNGPTVTLNGTYVCTNNTMVVSSGTISINGTATVSPALLTLTGGDLSGSALVRIANVMNWTGGFMSGSGRTLIENGASLTINSPNGVNLTTRTLENHGTITWSGAGNMNVNSAVITNGSGGLFRIQNAAVIGNNGGLPRVDNTGTIRKTSTGTTTSFIALNNYGSMDLQAGTLWLPGGGSHTGTFDVPAGTALQLSGTHSASSSATILGDGAITFGGGGGTVTWGGLVSVRGTNTFNGPTVTLNGTYICTNNTMLVSSGTVSINGTATVAPALLTLTGGDLSGSALVRIPNVMNWTGGFMSGSGRTLIENGASLTINSPNGVNLTTRTLENRGTLTWSGAGNMNVNNAVITNGSGGLFLIQNVATIGNNGGSPRVDNAGVLRKTSVGTSTSFIPLNNYGQADLRSGILALNGGYTSGSGAVLSSALGGTTAGSGYGQVQVSGAVTLNGGLDVTFANNFIPGTNDLFTILSAGTRSGSFSSFTYPSNLVMMTASNSPTSVVVRATRYNTNSAPEFVTDLLPASVVYSGRTATQSVFVSGATPISYQWKRDGTNLLDGGRISGAQSGTLVVASAGPLDAAQYQVAISNSHGTASSSSSRLIVQAVPKLNADGSAWSLQGTTPPLMISNSVTLTAGLGGTARTAFYKEPLFVREFRAAFVYRDVGSGGADGFTFCLQNDARGASALGAPGGGLGYFGITPSAALAFNIYAPNAVGIAFRTNGTVPAAGGYASTAPVNIASGNPIHVSLLYTAAVLRVMLTESNTPNTFTTTFPVNLPAILGAETAYVGFTGGDGGATSTQVVTDYTFVPLTPLSAEQVGSDSFLLSWPGTIGGYRLQSRATTTAPWSNLINPVTIESGLNRVLITPLTGESYFRLFIDPRD